MYHLLLEAGGMHQLERVQPEWFHEFFVELTECAAGHLFTLIGRDADQVLFARENETSPEDLSHFLRELKEIIQDSAEHVLGFTIVVDDFEPAAMKSTRRFIRMTDYLRRANKDNAIWLTEAAFYATDDLMDGDPETGLYRITAFRSDKRKSRSDFISATAEPGFTAAIHNLLESGSGGGYSGRVFLVSADPARLMAQVIETCLVAGAPVPVVVWEAEPFLSVAGSMYLAFIRSLLPDVSLPTGDLSPEEAENLANYRVRFSACTRRYLSPGWREGELRVAAMLLSRVIRSFERPVVIIQSEDTIPGSLAPVLEALLPAESGVLVFACRAETIEAEYPSREVVTLDSAPADGMSSDDYWSGLAATGASKDTGVTVPETSPLRMLDANRRAAIWIWDQSRGVLPESDLDTVFPACGISLAERIRIREELRRWGFLLPGSGVRFSPALDSRTIREAVDDIYDTLSDTYFSLVARMLFAGTISMCPRIWESVSTRMSTSDRFYSWHRLLHDLAAGGALDIVDQIAVVPGGGSIVDAGSLSARIRVGLRDSRGPETVTHERNALAALLESETVPRNLHSNLLLSLGEYALARRDYELALNYAKQSLYASQSVRSGRDSINDDGAGHLLMARIMLARRRMADAGSYLNYAREESERHDPVTSYMATGLELVRQFLHGNLSRVEKESRLLIPELLTAGFTEWLILVRFLGGRISFELGDYEKARLRFSSLAQFCVDCSLPQPGNVAAAWQIRSSGFSGRPLDELSAAFGMLGERVEPLLFHAEAQVRAGDFEAALQTLDRAEAANNNLERWPRLGVCWDDGFSAIEDALSAVDGGDSQVTRFIQVYRAWSFAHCDRSDEAVTLFYNLTRETQGLSHDPYGGLYNYLYSTILPEQRRNDRDDRLTVLGKAVKFVQERTSRIEDYRDKVRFLRANDWNRRLMEAAQRHNLV